MSITLNIMQEKMVTDLITTGNFSNADEVLQTALQLLERERESS